MDFQTLTNNLNQLFSDEPTLFEMVQSEKLIESKDPKLWKRISQFLDNVMYFACDFIPLITEKNAKNLALAHPMSYWLYRYTLILEGLCEIGMQLTKEEENIPVSLIRIPSLTIRFKKFLLPEIVEFNKKMTEELKEACPEYMKLRE